jgi:hypothetical protein
MTAHMMIHPKADLLPEGDDSPLSSPVLDESYKIRIGPSRSSLSPNSPDDDDISKPEEDGEAAQDLSVAGEQKLEVPELRMDVPELRMEVPGQRMEEEAARDLTDRRSMADEEGEVAQMGVDASQRRLPPAP